MVLRDTSHLKPAAILSIHTFDESGGNQLRNNAQYGIQPFYVAGDLAPFMEPSGTLMHSLRWESALATFKTVRGSSLRCGAIVSEHIFTSGVPSPDKEVFQLYFYVVPSDRNPLQNETKVVVEKFEYIP